MGAGLARASYQGSNQEVVGFRDGEGAVAHVELLDDIALVQGLDVVFDLYVFDFRDQGVDFSAVVLYLELAQRLVVVDLLVAVVLAGDEIDLFLEVGCVLRLENRRYPLHDENQHRRDLVLEHYRIPRLVTNQFAAVCQLFDLLLVQRLKFRVLHNDLLNYLLHL